MQKRSNDFDYTGNHSKGFGHNCEILLYLENVMVDLMSLQKLIKPENIYGILIFIPLLGNVSIAM